MAEKPSISDRMTCRALIASEPTPNFRPIRRIRLGHP